MFLFRLVGRRKAPRLQQISETPGALYQNRNTDLDKHSIVLVLHAGVSLRRRNARKPEALHTTSAAHVSIAAVSPNTPLRLEAGGLRFGTTTNHSNPPQLGPAHDCGECSRNRIILTLRQFSWQPKKQRRTTEGCSRPSDFACFQRSTQSVPQQNQQVSIQCGATD